VIVTAIVAAHQAHTKKDRLNEGGQHSQDEPDLYAYLCAERWADRTLAEEDRDGEQQARRGQRGRDGTGNASTASTLRCAEGGHQAGSEGKADDCDGGRLEGVAGILVLVVAVADIEPSEEAPDEHQNAQDAGDPYYPIPRAENAALYKQYQELAAVTPGVHFVGRLGTYKYYNMDQVVAQALTTFAKIAGMPRAECVGS